MSKDAKARSAAGCRCEQGATTFALPDGTKIALMPIAEYIGLTTDRYHSRWKCSGCGVRWSAPLEDVL